MADQKAHLLDSAPIAHLSGGMKKNLIPLSKYLSLILRHDPERIGLQLDPEGWIPVADLLERSEQALTREILEEIVATNPKQRFALSEDGQKVRARQGHSQSVDLGLKPLTPPDQLFHGTAARHLQVILSEGLKPMSRQHVHLSPDRDTAKQVGARHGSPVILTVDCRSLHAQGQEFFRAENGVWLTDAVAREFLQQ